MQATTLHHPKETLLIVDDEPLMTDLFQQMMSRHGYRVIAAHNGQEALTLVEKGECPVHLVIMDMTMPGMNGLETAQALQNRAPSIPILIATGLAADLDTATLPTNVMGLIQKPYYSRILLEQIRAILDTTEATA